MTWSVNELKRAVCTLKGKRVLIIGDLMLDAYLFGDAQRISPEAPVPVVAVDQEQYYVGGAGNVARNVAALGGCATLLGSVGDDAEGTRLCTLLAADGIVSGVTVAEQRPTTVKTRILARRQQMLRLDREDASPYSPTEQQALLDALAMHLPNHDVVILSDYAKGVISHGFMDGFWEMTRAMHRPVQVLGDPKPVNVGCYKGLSLITPNARETGECAGMPVHTSAQVLAAGRAILQHVGVEHVLTTLGADGMALFVSDQEVWHIPTVARDVFDVTGAGDTVIATLGLALAAGQAMLPACVLANYAAGIVVAHVGAATVLPEQLGEALERVSMPRITRWV